MKKYFLISIFVSFTSFSQTKLISHKSHSGSNETFALAIENNLFDIGESNFGVIPKEIKELVILDSVVYLTIDKVVTYTSEYTQRLHYRTKEKLSNDELVRIKADTLTLKPKSSKIGLTKKEAKAKIDSLKIYNNNLSETDYKGFDNKLNNKKKKNSLPIIASFPNIPNSFFMIITLSVLSFLVYLIAASTKFRNVEFPN